MSEDFTKEAEHLAAAVVASKYGAKARAGLVAEHLRTAYERGYRRAQYDIRNSLGFDEANLIGLTR